MIITEPVNENKLSVIGYESTFIPEEGSSSNAIRKEQHDKSKLLELEYARHLWMEKEIKSVANITISDVENFLSLAAKIPILPNVQHYSFGQANEALLDLKFKRNTGAKVLMVSSK